MSCKIYTGFLHPAREELSLVRLDTNLSDPIALIRQATNSISDPKNKTDDTVQSAYSAIRSNSHRCSVPSVHSCDHIFKVSQGKYKGGMDSEYVGFSKYGRIARKFIHTEVHNLTVNSRSSSHNIPRYEPDNCRCMKSEGRTRNDYSPMCGEMSSNRAIPLDALRGRGNRISRDNNSCTLEHRQRFINQHEQQ